MAGTITAQNLIAANNGTNLPGSFNTIDHSNPAPVTNPSGTGSYVPGVSTQSAPTVNTGKNSPLPLLNPDGSVQGSSAGTLPAALTPAQVQAQQDFSSGQTNANSLINSGISGAAGTYQGSILDYLSGLKQQQNTINSERVQDQLAKNVGTQGVLDMVSHGIQSGGVTLDNDNAASSSAGDALARAYADIGRRQLSSVGNQFAQSELKPTTDQTNLDQANTDEVRHSQLDKTTTINNIVNDATQKLTALNQMALYASIPDRINIDQQIQSIKQQAMDSLSAYDQQLSSGISGITPEGGSDVLSQAANLQNAGTAPTNAFQTNTNVPTQFQNTGPFPSDLPLFTIPSGKKQTA